MTTRGRSRLPWPCARARARQTARLADERRRARRSGKESRLLLGEEAGGLDLLVGVDLLKRDSSVQS
jgi:hypothetical protein